MENTIFVTPQDELAEIGWDLLSCLQTPEKEQKKREFKEFLDSLC